jgi:hypothetical protein
VASPHRATPGGVNPRAPGAATCDAPTMDPRVAANRALWNEWTPIHVRSAFYDVEGWKSGGRADLYPLLVSEVGDVAGKDLLHLQCHFGLDTLSLKATRD